MSSRHEPGGATAADEEPLLGEAEDPITTRVMLAAVAGGLLGVIAMVPLLVGIPQALGVFRADPLIDFANLGIVIGLEPSLPLGAAIFVLAGAIVLPMLFVVAATFLPPRSPDFARGVTFATITWTGFLIAFWPSGDLTTVALFLAFSLLSHLVYGLVLGVTLDRLTGIPHHPI